MEDKRDDSSGAQDVWSFRGYHLGQSDFISAMVHFYRGEMSRSNTWRNRLDNTTNWSVITTAAVLTFVFAASTHSHVVILISMCLVWLFLVIESRRYRYYELWTLRIRLMETDFFAGMLRPPFTPHEEWSERLIDSLLAPEFPISFWEALGRRLRRNYIWIFLILGLAWSIKLSLYPTVVHSLDSFFAHATVGFIPGSAVILSVVVFYSLIFLIAILTFGLQASPGEVLSRREVLGVSAEILQSLARAAGDIPFIARREHLVIIITDKPAEVGERLLEMLKRGVTALQGKGMYSGNERAVLFCAIEPSEVNRLKAIVYAADEKAFVVVNPTEEVLGGGFRDLRPAWKRKKTGKKE